MNIWKVFFFFFVISASILLNTIFLRHYQRIFIILWSIYNMIDCSNENIWYIYHYIIINEYTEYKGIDFIFIYPDNEEFYIHFLSLHLWNNIIVVNYVINYWGL